MLPQSNTSKLVIGLLLVSFLPVATCLFLTFYASRFGLSRSVILFGTSSSAAAISLLFLIADGLRFILKARIVERLLMLSVASYIFFFAALYELAFATNSLWGDTASFSTILSFIGHSAAGWELISAQLHDSDSRGLLVVPTIVVLLSFGTAVTLGRFFAMGFTRVNNGLKFNVTIVINLAVFLASSAVGCWTYNDERHRLYGEPLLSFINVVRVNNLTKYDNRKMMEAFRDDEIGDTYKHMKPSSAKNIIIIFSDSVRADHVSAYDYARDTTPFLRSLWEQGRLTRVETAVTMCPDSFCGITTTMSSRPFDEISSSNYKIFNMLADLGYKTNFFLSGDHTGWSYLRDYYGAKIDNFVDYNRLKSDSLDDEPLVRSFAAIPKFDGRPNLFYFFLMATHQFGIKSPEYARFKPAARNDLKLFALELTNVARYNGVLKAGKTVITDQDIQEFNNIYDNGIVQTDANIEKIFTTLHNKGYLDNSLVFVVADHGDAIGEHDHFGHNHFLYQEDIRVPLLVYDSDGGLPKLLPFATLMDLGPTIARKLDVPIPATWEGRPLGEGTPSYTIHQTRRGNDVCFGVIDPSTSQLMKFFECNDLLVDAKLFNLSKDPQEAKNLVEVDTSSAEKYRNILAERFNNSEIRP